MTEISVRKQDRRLPPEVHAQLVETLFGTTGSFIAGMIGGLLVPTVAYIRTQDPLYLACAIGILAFSALRLGVFMLHEREAEDVRLANAVVWEKRYAVGAVGFMTAVGITAALLCYRAHDDIMTLYGVVITLACAGALAGRNAGRPMIVYGQVLGVCLPLAVVFVFFNNAWYVGLAAILGLVMISAKSTTKFLNGVLVSTLMTGREARIQQSRFGAALDSMSHGLCMADHNGSVIVINRRLREFFNLSFKAGEIDTHKLAEEIAESGRMSADDRKAFLEAWAAHFARMDPTVFTATIAGRIYDFRCEPRGVAGAVVVVEDVTEARAATSKIERMAHYDALTGLPNRILFHRQLEKRLAERPGVEQLALLSIDLDQFKEVNDTRGHPTGDALLRIASKRLRQTVKGEDIVSRFGGDEFQVLMSVENAAAAQGAAQRLIASLSDAYSIDGQVITIGASIGIAFADQCAYSADELLRCADMALYRAKGEGRGVNRVFSPELDAALQRKQEIEQDLRDAIANDTLRLEYQPIVDIRTGQIVLCEALVRMHHPVKGVVPPDEFISIAEETGLIVKLGDWVLRRACQDAAQWPKSISVAVNFSAKQFLLRKNLVQDITAVLQETGLEPARFEVEITESTIIEAKDAMGQLKAMSEAGLKISLDDFGTGYSSLSYLRQFPVDKIKIDRSFAEDITSRASQAVIGSVSVLGHLLGVQIIMEGIETQQQLSLTKAWNIHFVQGYFLGRPQAQSKILPLLKSQPGSGKEKLKSVA
jgi:diguanylate cyclase (GGDEF)-like protein